MKDNLIIHAAVFANAAHNGQKRKYTGSPYFEHPMRVASAVMLLPVATPEMVCAALLHDTIEDCDLSASKIAAYFGHLVADVVQELTNIKDSSLSREEQKASDWERLARVSMSAKLIKLLDRIDNLKELVRDAEAFPEARSFLPTYRSESAGLIRALDRYVVPGAGINVYLELRGKLMSLIK